MLELKIVFLILACACNGGMAAFQWMQPKTGNQFMGLMLTIHTIIMMLLTFEYYTSMDLLQ